MAKYSGNVQTSATLLKFGKLRKRFGERLSTEIRTRGVTKAQLAKILGITRVYAEQLTEGRTLPGPELAARLKAWMLGNESFEDKPLVRRARKRRKKNYSRVTILMPASTVARVGKAAAKVGYSRDSFITLAVNRLCDDEPTITTIQQAMATIEHNLVIGALDRAPEILEILELDEEILKLARKRKPRTAKAPQENAFPLNDMLDAPRYDGPATRTALTDELEDRFDDSYSDEW